MAIPLGVFCEPNLGHFIQQPANAWSNLAYVLVGLWMICKIKPEKNLIKFLGPIVTLIGLSSFYYHAVWTLLGEYFDLGSMVLLTSFLIAWNVKRLKQNNFGITFTTILIIGVLTLYLTGVFTGGYYEFGKYIFGTEIVIMLVIEYLIYQKKKSQYDLVSLMWALIIFLVAWLIWYLDRSGILCPSYSHILNGHVVWHILTAISLIFVYRFYNQFGD